MAIAAWKAEDAKAVPAITRASDYYTNYKTMADKYAADIVKAAGVTGAKLTELYNELWEQRMKLDVQAKESDKVMATVASDLVKENPELKAKLATDAHLKSFTDAVESMGNALVEAVQAKAEAATLDKAEAGIFSLDATAQEAYDKTQLELKQAAEAKAKENAEAAVAALKAAKAAGTWKDDGASIADKIKAMKAANDAKVADEKA